MQVARVILYPIPYVCVLTGVWPEFGSVASIAIYTAFIFTEVVFGIISAVMLDSMMADVVEESETHTNRRSEGLFFATRAFAGKFVSAAGIIGAGVIVSVVGFDTITNVADFTDEHRFTQAIFFLPIYCTVCLSAVACILMYRIDRESHEANLEIIKARNSNTQANAST
jgi:Na+/melibiose symporter-like transporter